MFTARYVYCCCQHLTLISSVAHLQIFLSSANLLHSLTFNSNKESRLISSSYLRRGLLAGPLPWYFPISTSVGLLVLSNRTVWATHRHLLQTARNICYYISVHSCSLRLGLHPTAFPWTGPNIFLSLLPAFLMMTSHCQLHCYILVPVTLTVLYIMISYLLCGSHGVMVGSHHTYFVCWHHSLRYF